MKDEICYWDSINKFNAFNANVAILIFDNLFRGTFFMEPKKDSDVSKMQRVLSHHCLESLVFEKRERKPTINPLTNIHHQKQTHPKQIPPKQPNTIKDKKATIKQKVKAKQQKKVNHTKKDESQIVSPKPKGKQKQPKNQPGSSPKKKGRPRKQRPIDQASQNQGGLSNSQQQQELNDLIQEQKIVRDQIEEQQIQNEVNEQEPEQKQKDEPEKVAGQQSEKNDAILDAEKEDLMREKSEVPQTAKMNLQKGQKQMEKQGEQSQNMDNDEDENSEISQHQSDHENFQKHQRVLRSRKTKGQALKKFTMMQDLQYEDDEEEGYCYETKKRRSGLSTQNLPKTQTKANLLNRIFRKTQKVFLPSFSLTANLLQVNFKEFVNKFGVFDMVHCSLPLEILTKLKDLNLLIPKGFIFIWVEKKQISIGYHFLNRWGFDVIDQIMWIKTQKKYSQLICKQPDEDELFSNCRSTCLVGYKCSVTEKTQYFTKKSNNLIFAQQKESSIEKPDYIYEIGDLMMPGAKKLELGGREIGGWLSLIHKETSLLRCHQCLKRYEQQHLFLCSLPEQNQIKEIKCRFCLSISSQTLLSKQIEYRVSEAILCCSKCQKIIQPLQGLLTHSQQVSVGYCRSNQLLIKECFEIEKQQNEPLYCHYNRQMFCLAKNIECSKCGKKKLFRSYYECISCKKNHQICSTCFWLQSQNQANQDETCKQWRYKPVYQMPQNKSICFSCHEQCPIPYWGCETCQGWYWCGNCDQSKIPEGQKNHCHYVQKHNLHLIV